MTVKHLDRTASPFADGGGTKAVKRKGDEASRSDERLKGKIGDAGNTTTGRPLQVRSNAGAHLTVWTTRS